MNINLFVDKHIHKNRREEFAIEIQMSFLLGRCALIVLYSIVIHL